MKKFLSIILTIAIVLSLAVSPAMALTTDEIINASGDNWETVCILDFADYENPVTSIGSTAKFSFTGMTQKTGFVDTENNITYPDLTQIRTVVSKADIVKDYPHLEHNAMNDKYLKWEKNLASAMFRVNNIFPESLLKIGDIMRISLEICLTDVVTHVNADGSDVPVDNNCVDFLQFNLALTTGSGNGTVIAKPAIPVNQWVTINSYYTVSDTTLDSIKFDPGIHGDKIDCVTEPFAKTVFMGRLTYEKLRNNNQPVQSTINYTEDFERYNHSYDKYTVDGTKVTNDTSVTDKLHFVTPVATADNGVLGEANMSYIDSANPNDKSQYAKGSTTIDSNNKYEYIYPTSGTANGKYHLTGDASLGDTGVTDATFGLGYAGNKYFSTSEHLSAADRLSASTKKRSVITLPNAFSGKNMIVASGIYNKNAAVRMNNIFGSHPSKSDVGKKMIISYYVYADSKMGAYKASDKDYASAEPVAVDKTKPVKLMTSFNGPMGNIYKYRLSYDDTAISTTDIPWDTWTKVQVLSEITSDCIDNLVIENGENTLKNCLQISQFGATDQIADTLYFDNLSVQEIEAGTKAEYAVYKFDGSYDIAAKILSSTEAGNPTVQLVVGEYDSEGRLLSVKTSENKTFSYSQLPVSVSVSNFKPIKETSSLRAFLIDSYTGLCPYISPTDVKVIAEEIE